MGQLSNQHSSLFQDDENIFNEQLDKCAKSLRYSAQNIVNFIDKLSNQTESLENLKCSYRKFESMPAKDLCSGIEEIKNRLLQVEFTSKLSPMKQDEFVGFFELQNAFNAEVNAFVKKVIQLEVIN